MDLTKAVLTREDYFDPGQRRDAMFRDYSFSLTFTFVLFASAGCILPPQDGQFSVPIIARTESLRPGFVSHTSEPIRTVSNESQPAPTEMIDEGKKELTEEGLVQQVLASNPTIAQMTAALEAASARVPQMSSGDDPMFSSMLAPASFGSSAVQPGYRLEVGQKIYFPGKLRLKGMNAAAEASAAGNDLDDMRLQLRESARLAFADYFLVTRAQEVNNEGFKLLKEFKQNADTRYRTGLVSQQDVLQAELEIGKQKERLTTLERMLNVARARINTLMHLPPTAPLATPATPPAGSVALPPGEALVQIAVANRPDLRALADRIAAEEASLGLAHKEFYPDVEVFGAYDTIMGNGPMRDLAPQVGVRFNLPVRLKKRHAAVSEAEAKVYQRSAELAAKTDQVKFQVQEALEQYLESQRILQLYNSEILPAAHANVKAAQSAYLTGKIPFLSLIEAQRSVVNLRDRYYEVNADLSRRRANLERALAGPLPGLER